MSSGVLITGASGFIGGHLLASLAAGGRVVALDAAAPRRTSPPDVRWERVDIRDAAAVGALVAEVRPEIVYHLAAQISPSVSMREPRLDAETNAVATLELALAAAEAGCRRFVFVSTGGALYGDPAQLPASESTPIEPLSIYGASKAAAELYLGAVARITGLEVAVVRPSNVYGPWQDPHGEAGVIAIFAQRMLRDEPVTIFGDGSQTRDYVYVDDLVDAIRRAGAARLPSTCNVATGVETSTGEIFARLARLTGCTRDAVYAAERPGDVARIALDASLAGQAWGWAPRVSLEEGLRRSVEWFRGQVPEGAPSPGER